jgi:hypothetical protein
VIRPSASCLQIARSTRRASATPACLHLCPKQGSTTVPHTSRPERRIATPARVSSSACAAIHRTCAPAPPRLRPLLLRARPAFKRQRSKTGCIAAVAATHRWATAAGCARVRATIAACQLCQRGRWESAAATACETAPSRRSETAGSRVGTTTTQGSSRPRHSGRHGRLATPCSVENTRHGDPSHALTASLGAANARRMQLEQPSPRSTP